MSIMERIHEAFDNVRETRIERRSAQSDYYRYKAVVASEPTTADDDMLEEAVVMIDVFEGEIECGAGEALPRKMRGFLIVLLVFLELVAVILAMAPFSQVLPDAWQIPAFLGATLLIGSIIDIVVDKWIYDAIGASAMKHRIRRLNSWYKKAAKSVVLDRHDDELALLGIE